MRKDVIEWLHEQKVFEIISNDLREQRPKIPRYDLNDPDSVEKWKAASYSRDGYDVALALLGIPETDE